MLVSMQVCIVNKSKQILAKKTTTTKISIKRFTLFQYKKFYKKMQRYFFHIAYKGSNYRGWQRQAKVNSVQEVIENRIAKSLNLSSVSIMGCGRTDAGVHASQYFFHTDITVQVPDNWLYILNKILPNDIAIYDIIPMESRPEPHARFHATERVYDYLFHNYKDPFLDDHSSLYIGKELDFDEMKKAVAIMTKYNDYRAYCRSPDKYNTTITNINAAQLFISQDKRQLRFRIASNRFLTGQIRILFQKLLEIGTGDFSFEEFEFCLANKTSPKLIRPAHPQGLFLSKITYPFLELPVKSNFMAAETFWEKL